jgi:hypothetical protein
MGSEELIGKKGMKLSYRNVPKITLGNKGDTSARTTSLQTRFEHWQSSI